METLGFTVKMSNKYPTIPIIYLKISYYICIKRNMITYTQVTELVRLQNTIIDIRYTIYDINVIIHFIYFYFSNFTLKLSVTDFIIQR